MFISWEQYYINTIHGTGNVSKDVFRHLQVKNNVERKLLQMPEDSVVKDKLKKIISKKHQEFGNAKQYHAYKLEELINLSKDEFSK